MTEQEKFLKSLCLAGVEWELKNDMKNASAGSAGPDPLSPEREKNFVIAGEAKQSNKKTAAASSFVIPSSSAPLSNSEILDIAKKLAAGPDIISAIKKFSEHPLFSAAKNTVSPHLPDAPSLLAITDIPSLSDDGAGQILTGPDGELFDKMMSAIGLSRDQIAIAPLVFWRPAGGRAPGPDELAFCRPFIDRIIGDFAARTKSGKILALGALAAKEIAGASLAKDHGKQFAVKNLQCAIIYKPDFILQNPEVKKDVWEALQLIK